MQIKRWTDTLDDIEAKIKEIETQRSAQRKWCSQFKKMATPTALIELSSYQSHHAHVVGGPAPLEPDCSAGICYKAKEPFRINFGLEGGGIQVLHLDLPNRAGLVGIDIRRAFFIKKIQEIQFDDNGFLNSVTIKKPSELVAVSRLPLDVISAVAEGLRVRVDVLNAQRDLAKKEAALLEAQAKLEDARSPLESAPARTESAAGRGRARGPAAATNKEALQ